MLGGISEPPRPRTRPGGGVVVDLVTLSLASLGFGFRTGAPALDGEQALVVPGHDVDELGVFGLKVVVEAIEARIG